MQYVIRPGIRLPGEQYMKIGKEQSFFCRRTVNINNLKVFSFDRLFNTFNISLTGFKEKIKSYYQGNDLIDV